MSVLVVILIYGIMAYFHIRYVIWETEIMTEYAKIEEEMEDD